MFILLYAYVIRNIIFSTSISHTMFLQGFRVCNVTALRLPTTILTSVILFRHFTPSEPTPFVFVLRFLYFCTQTPLSNLALAECQVGIVISYEKESFHFCLSFLYYSLKSAINILLN